MKDSLLKKSKKDIEFQKIIQPLISNSEVQEMKKYRQHFNTSCFEHCYRVSYYCYLFCKKHHLDYKSAARARNVT